MFYPERAEEISDYIVNLNSFGQVPLEGIVAYDEACRYKVPCHREITLDNSLSFTEGWTNHIMRGLVDNHGSRHGSYHIRPDGARDSTEFYKSVATGATIAATTRTGVAGIYASAVKVNI